MKDATPANVAKTSAMTFKVNAKEDGARLQEMLTLFRIEAQQGGHASAGRAQGCSIKTQKTS